MKVRWTKNSLRMRITPVELSELTAGRAIEETLGPGFWQVLVGIGEEAGLYLETLTARVELSANDVTELAKPECEGVYFRSDHEPPIRFYVEKDFPCAHPRPEGAAEPESETFSAPKGFKARHRSG
jgi:hypothetical protein